MRYGRVAYLGRREPSSLNANPAAAQICTCHQLLHPQVLQLLIKLFETEHSQLDVMEQVRFRSQSPLWNKTTPPPLTLCWLTCPRQLELKKTLLDRMVHLLSRGYVLPVVGYIRKCLEKLNTDISLIRYFVTEVTSAPDGRRQALLHVELVQPTPPIPPPHPAVCLQVLDVIAPPYTSDFVQLFLPILENDSIAGTIRTEGEHDPVAEFIGV